MLAPRRSPACREASAIRGRSSTSRRMGSASGGRSRGFYRAPGPLVDTTPPELDIVAVSTPEEVYEFEAVSVRGFGAEADTVEPGSYHPPTIPSDDAMKMFIGRVDGKAVADPMGYRTGDSVGV